MTGQKKNPDLSRVMMAICVCASKRFAEKDRSTAEKNASLTETRIFQERRQIELESPHNSLTTE